MGWFTIGPLECWGVNPDPPTEDDLMMDGDIYYYGNDHFGWDDSEIDMAWLEN